MNDLWMVASVSKQTFAKDGERKDRDAGTRQRTYSHQYQIFGEFQRMEARCIVLPLCIGREFFLLQTLRNLHYFLEESL